MEDQEACAGIDPETFYPSSDFWTKGDAERIAQAKAICDGCPIKAECLAKALEVGDTWAILGGTTPDERRAMKRREAAADGELRGRGRRRAPAACGTVAGYERHRLDGEATCTACKAAAAAYGRAKRARRAARRSAA